MKFAELLLTQLITIKTLKWQSLNVQTKNVKNAQSITHKSKEATVNNVFTDTKQRME